MKFGVAGQYLLMQPPQLRARFQAKFPRAAACASSGVLAGVPVPAADRQIAHAASRIGLVTLVPALAAHQPVRVQPAPGGLAQVTGWPAAGTVRAAGCCGRAKWSIPAPK